MENKKNIEINFLAQQEVPKYRACIHKNHYIAESLYLCWHLQSCACSLCVYSCLTSCCSQHFTPEQKQRVKTCMFLSCQNYMICSIWCDGRLEFEDIIFMYTSKSMFLLTYHCKECWIQKDSHRVERIDPKAFGSSFHHLDKLFHLYIRLYICSATIGEQSWWNSL